MSDDRCKATVLSVLNEVSEISSINFAWKGYAITPGMYRTIREYIESGRVGVTHRLGGGRESEYDSTHDQLIFSFDTASYTPRKAIIIHEVTHAICDMRGHASMTVLDSECLAYIAQCIFGRRICGAPDTFILEDSDRDNPEADPIFVMAWEMAANVVDHPGMSFEGEATAPLEAQVLAHRWYQGADTQRAGYVAILPLVAPETDDDRARRLDRIRRTTAGPRPTAGRSGSMRR